MTVAWLVVGYQVGWFEYFRNLCAHLNSVQNLHRMVRTTKTRPVSRSPVGGNTLLMREAKGRLR